ncbi:MAG: DNA mismatch repair endonuclease MutL [Desulfotomaculum sp.]|nr:DNA mismatch repair endonuclease MutL [Desulfotomaculum sp.]
MARIHILSENIANKIAAGEVIERPLSVVKELVENSLDAGASRISVDIRDGGTSSITVSDNGCGIEVEDAALAFSRHATSKIYKVEDLFQISTLGFRGEALPSIASVAKVTMLTRVPNSDKGVKLIIEGGKIIEEVPVGCQPGTKVTVQDLFYNTPARKKHLKSPNSEAGLISDLISRLALSRPNVSFKLTSQGRVLLETPGNDKLIDTIAAVNGLQVAKKMIPVEGQTSGIHISGYVSKPELSRATRLHQTVIVNGRYVKSRLVSDALQEAYHTLLSSKRHPVAVLVIELAPGMVDVNVHPAKMEIRISKEKELSKLITSTVQNALRTPKIVPLVEQTLNNQKTRTELKTETASKKNNEQTKFNFQMPRINKAPSILKNTVTNVNENKEIKLKNNDQYKEHDIKNYQDKDLLESNQEVKEENKNYTHKFPDLLPLGQLLPTYILAQGQEGLYIIDQHAAHERVLYEKYIKQRGTQKNSQMLLVPVVLELSYQENLVLTENIISFRELGFILEHFGGNTYMLRGVPADFPQGDEVEFFYEILETNTSNFYDILAAKLACRSAIKAGQKLTIDEMENLIMQMSELDNPYTCPHGRPTMINLSFEELTKRFKR